MNQTKLFSHLYLAKFLDISTKSFFSCTLFFVLIFPFHFWYYCLIFVYFLPIKHFWRDIINKVAVSVSTRLSFPFFLPTARIPRHSQNNADKIFRCSSLRPSSVFTYWRTIYLLISLYQPYFRKFRDFCVYINSWDISCSSTSYCKCLYYIYDLYSSACITLVCFYKFL